MKAPIQDFRFCRGWNKRTTPVNENLESVVRHFFGTGVPLRCTSTRPVIGSDISHRGCRLHIYVSEKSPGASEMERRELSSGTRLRWTVSGHLGASVYRLVLYLPTTTLFLWYQTTKEHVVIYWLLGAEGETFCSYNRDDFEEKPSRDHNRRIEKSKDWKWKYESSYYCRCNTRLCITSVDTKHVSNLESQL